MIPLSEHYAEMLILELSRHHIPLSSDTAERLLRTMRNGGRGNLRLVNTESAETESASTTPENAELATRALDLMRDYTLSVSAGSREPIRLSMGYLGVTVELLLTTMNSTRNGDGQSGSSDGIVFHVEPREGQHG